MKWNNHYIDVVKRDSIPHYSKLDDIGIPLRLFELFFDDALVDMIVGHTKWYGHRKKADTSFENL